MLRNKSEEGGMDASKTALEEAFRVLGEMPEKTRPEDDIRTQDS